METLKLIECLRSVMCERELPKLNQPEANSLSQILHNHNLAARGYRVLKHQKDIPESLLSDLEKAYFRSIGSSQAFMQIAELLKDLFHQHDIQFAFIKGPVLAKRIYHDPYDRVFHDIDLVFRNEDRELVERILSEQNFKRGHEYERFYANDMKSEFFYQGDPKLCVECHFALGYNEFLIEADFIQSEGHSIIDLKSELDFLVFHAGVQHRFQKLTWLLDLHLFLEHYKAEFKPEINSLKPAYAMGQELLEVFFNGKNDIAPWVLNIIDESKLTSWQIAKMRIHLQGGFPGFFKYAGHRFLAKVKGN